MLSTKWITTINNPEGDEFDLIKHHPQIQYACGQLEKGESGTVHLQIFTQYKRNVRGASISKIWPRSRNEPVRKDNGAREYCMKEDTRVEGPWEYGEYKTLKGNKNAALSIQEGIEPIELVNNGTISYLHLRAAEYYAERLVEQNIIKEEEDSDLEKKRHYWIFGERNIGKTTWRKKNLTEDTWEIPTNDDWKGYRGEHNLYIDEFKG